MTKLHKLKSSCALFAITLLLLTAIAVPAQRGTTRRVRFARGRTTAVLKGAVVRGTTDRYILSASEGQTMTVHITSVENNAVFTIYTPRNTGIMGSAEETTDWTGELPQSGNYIIEVGGTRGNATYTMEVTIR